LHLDQGRSAEVTECEDIFARQEYGADLGFGRRPALLLIDFLEAFVDPNKLGGGNIADAARSSLLVLRAAREAGLPVFFSRHIYVGDGSDSELFCRKVPRQIDLRPDAADSQIVEPLRPLECETTICKRFPSAFFATDLADHLRRAGVDTLIVVGCSTSGCVQASVVDSMCYGFRPIVVEECVGDRAAWQHEAALFNMRMKYADVLPASAVVRSIGQPADQLGRFAERKLEER
jgi:maleamate amidohydrolase